MFSRDVSDSYYNAQYGGLGAGKLSAFAARLKDTARIVTDASKSGTEIYKQGNEFYRIVAGKKVPVSPQAAASSQTIIREVGPSDRPAWLIPAAVVAGVLALGLMLKRRSA